MITLITSSGGLPLNCDDYYVKELASGLNELVFRISIWDEAYPQIQEEASVKEASDGSSALYLVKAIDGGSETAEVKCQLDLDEWRSVMVIGYSAESKSVGEIVNAVKPTGWTVTNNSGITYKRTITLEGATPMDVLEQCRSTFKNITFRFDNVGKTVEIVNMANGQNIGSFATRDLNLKSNDYKGKSSGFATRLYAYGKDGLSFADINGGKPYVENHTYSDRVICAYWQDERYTIKANLLADAQAKIDAMAVPSRSFDLDVVDLAALDPVNFSHLSFPLFSVVALIDQTRSGTKVNHTVVERWRYPYHPEKNKVVLSTAAPRIQSQVTQIINSVTNVNSDWSQQQAAYINALTASVLGARGGAVRLLDTDDDGVPDTLYIADDPDPTQAVNVWRFNYLGWGASTNGYDGPFVLGADFSNGGTLYANNLNVTNINGENILAKTIGNAPIADSAIVERTLDTDAVTTTKIKAGAVTGGSGGKIASSTITTGNTVSGINTSLGYADYSNDVWSGTRTAGYCTASVGTFSSLRANGYRTAWISITVNGVTYTVLGQGAPA